LSHVETTNYKTAMSFFKDFRLFRQFDDKLTFLTKGYVSIGRVLSYLLIERFRWEKN